MFNNSHPNKMQTFHGKLPRLKIFPFLLTMCLLFYACPPTDPDMPQGPSQGIELEADEASEYLNLSNSTKITGQLPPAPDGQLAINVRDTIYAVKGHPEASPILMIRHEPR